MTTSDPDRVDAAGRKHARLAWTDPLTGDRLSVDLWGSEAFLRGLVALGFELEDGTTDAAGVDRAGGRARVRSSAEPTPLLEGFSGTASFLGGDAA